MLATVFGRTAVPAWMSRTGFRLLDPVKSLRQQVVRGLLSLGVR